MFKETKSAEQRSVDLERLLKTLEIDRAWFASTLTASIAHEINQPLTGILTNSSTCVRMLGGDPPNVTGALEIARRNIRDSKRAAEIIARLRAQFSQITMRTPDVDLNEAAAEVITLLASELQGRRVMVRTEFASDLPKVTADRVQLQQVIFNLLRNASDAMIDVQDRPRLTLIRTMRDGHDHVRLTVQDVGVGFAPEHTEAMFQAFYTTKSAGLGIGLSVCRTIIESHNGRLWGECGTDGATFGFQIPVSPGHPSA